MSSTTVSTPPPPAPIPAVPPVPVLAGAPPSGTPPAPADAPAPAATPTPPKDEFTKKFSALSRKNAAVREREQALKAQEEALKAKYAPLEGIQELAKGDPLGALAKLGLTYDQLTQAMLAGGQPDAALVKVTQIEARLEKERVAREEAEKAAEVLRQEALGRQALDAWRQEVAQTIKTSTSHEFVKAEENAADVIIEMQTEHYNRTQQFLPYQEALDRAEAYYEKRARALMSVPKVKSWLAPAPVPTPAPVSPSGASRTLNSSMTPQTQPAPTAMPSEAERIARAKAIMAAAHAR